MSIVDQIERSYRAKISSTDYTFCHYKQFDYSLLQYIIYRRKPGNGDHTSYNDVIIMADTETSKKYPDKLVKDKKGRVSYETDHNHVVAWTISIRAYHHNICTLYGRKPSSLIRCIERIHQSMQGIKTIIFIQNLAYDYVFLRQYMYDAWLTPVRQLNTKSHYPISIEFLNGLIFKDSYILSQRSLDKWASDLDCIHKKSVGLWDYDKLRNQNTPLIPEEKEYIEHDTLAGVECLDKTCEALGKKIYTLPMTATGIPREQTRKRGKKKAHDEFLTMALSLEQYHKFEHIFHGGYTHGNRHYIDMTIDRSNLIPEDGYITCRDFVSSYPYTMLAFKFPMEKFTATDDCDYKHILKNMDNHAYAFRFIAVDICLKDDWENFPYLQYSKCLKVINPILDNGRILKAAYIEILINEYDMAIIADQYNLDKIESYCVNVETALKRYLPRWFTDYAFEVFTEKTMLKGGDPVAYSIAKGKFNSLYGMCVQHSLQNDIVEDYDTGEFTERPPADERAAYDKYLNNIRTVLPYQWGVWVTSIAAYNVHQLIKCCEIPLYTDTDSCYGINWDPDKLNAYNEGCKERLIANNYGPVVRDGREYWLGVAETEPGKDDYTEFRYQGAKRYCGRCAKDGELHITVAGVPKKGAACLKDNIENFAPGFIFDGLKTGKKLHTYFFVDEPYIDAMGNETADSISLTPCDYLLSSVYVYDWDEIMKEEVTIQVYDED